MTQTTNRQAEITQAAAAKIKTQSTRELCEMIAELRKRQFNSETSSEDFRALYQTQSWIEKELENRDADAFWKWTTHEAEVEIVDNPTRFFV